MSPLPLLHGLRVLDASRVLAGPYCAQVLGDLGADVIKLERPGEGDDTRGWGPPFHGDWSAYFLSCNRNKRGLTLDLSREAGRALLEQLLPKCDVLLENFRSDSLDKLGLEPQAVLQRHPKLIVCSISGYGRTGPMRDHLGYDFAIQALSGLMAVTGEPNGSPMKVGVAVTDVLTGLHAAVGILACLQARAVSGHGYTLDLSLLDCAVASQVNLAQAYLTSGRVAARQGNAHLQIVPYQSFATQDGWLVVTVGNDRQWQHFCTALDAHDLATDARFATNPLRVANRSQLIPELELRMRLLNTAEWVSRFHQHQVPHAEVQNYQQLFDMDVIAARGMRQTIHGPDGQPVELVGSPFHLTGASPPETRFPPKLGQHSAELLTELLGLQPEVLEQLAAEKII